jgi:endonuclease YncB( thermonuclease family)
MRIRPAALLIAAAMAAALPFALGDSGERLVARLVELALRQFEESLPEQGATTASHRVSVTDGDTLVIGEDRIRLHGIDAPELSQHCQSGERDIPCGQLARTHLQELVREVEGIRCAGEARDRYHRIIARCTRSDGVDLSRAMVRQGWALAYVEYGGGEYAQDERRARADRAGLHALEMKAPEEYRRRARQGQ